LYLNRKPIIFVPIHAVKPLWQIRKTKTTKRKGLWGRAEHVSKPAKEMPHDMPADHEKHQMPPAKMDHKMTGKSAPLLPKIQENAHRGKKYTNNFNPLASDVSSMKEVAADGVDPGRPWPPTLR
jgi:hypothetical protein